TGVSARLQALKALLCEQALKVDLTHVRRFWHAQASQQSTAFEEIREVVAAQERLARRGLAPAPRFVPPGPTPPAQRTPEDRTLIRALLAGATDRPRGQDAGVSPPSRRVGGLPEPGPTPSDRARGVWVFQPDRLGSKATLHVDPLPTSASAE